MSGKDAGISERTSRRAIELLPSGNIADVPVVVRQSRLVGPPDHVRARQAGPEAFDDREALGRHSPEAGRRAAEDLDRRVRQAEVLAQEVRVARAVQPGLALLRRLAREHVAC